MAIAKGVAKKVVIKRESTDGVAPGASGAQSLRRVESSLSPQKDTYQSNEIRPDYQVVDFRHGVRRVAGNINGELSLGTYQEFLAAALRKEWTAGVTSGALTDVTASSSAPQFVRASGSWLTDGFKVGDVIRWSGWATATSNNAKNYRITALTATDMTVAESVSAETAGASVTATVQGKKLWVPTTGHTDLSFAIEHHYSDIGETELFLGNKINTIELGLPSTGMATINAGIMGRKMDLDPNGDGSAPYFTSPTDPTSTAIMAAVNGNLRLGGSDVAIITGLTINISGNYSGEPVVGSNTVPQLFPGRVMVTGQFTAYYEQGSSLVADFWNENELAISAKLDAGSADDTDFMGVVMNRIKLGGNDKDDGEKGLIQTVPFQALMNTSGGSGTAYDETTIAIQDSTL